MSLNSGQEEQRMKKKESAWALSTDALYLPEAHIEDFRMMFQLGRADYLDF